MPTKGPLSAGDLTKLAGPSGTKAYLSVVNSSTTATARINQSSFTYPLAQLTVNTTSGNWSSVAMGMCVWIGSTAGAHDRGIYYVRKAGNATTLYIGEMSYGDPGAITQAVRTAGFTNSDYITVYLYRRDVFSIAPRIIASTGTIYEHYEDTVGTSNTTPEPTVDITINGGDRHAGFVDTGVSTRTIALVALPSVWPTSSSISSHAWTLPAAATVTGGSISSDNVTFTLPSSSENYEIKYVATDNNGAVATAYRELWVHDRSGSNAPLPITQLNATWNRTGARLTVILNGNVLSSIPLGAMVCVWLEANWNGSDITSAATTFIGWVIRQSEISEPGLHSAELEIVGPAGLMEKLGSYSQFFDTASSPASWQQVVSSLEYIDFLAWWCVRHRAQNLINLFNWTKLGISNLTGRLPQWRIEPAGNLLGQIQNILVAYRSNFGCNPDGSFMLRQHPNLVTYANRGALTTRATLNEGKIRSLTSERGNRPRVRKVRGEGFSWDGKATLPTPLLSDAPGDAPGQGAGEETLQGQTVEHQADLNTRTGLYYAMVNNPYENVNISIGKNWASMIYPAEMAFLATSIASQYRPDAAAFAINTIPQSVSMRIMEGGSVDTDLALEGETAGVDGTTVIVPTQATPTIIYNAPPAVVQSSDISGIASNGASAVACRNDRVGLTVNWFDSSPTWQNITGTGLSGTFLYFVFDPFSPRLGASKAGALAAYMATTAGIYYCSNLLVRAGAAVWTQKLSLTMSYCIIRTPIWAQGTIYIHYYPTTPGQPTAKKLTNYGASTAWSTAVGTQASAVAVVGMDCDQYGNDEVLAAGDVGTTSYIYRISGGTPSQIAGTAFSSTTGQPATISFIQKPLLTPSGVSNTSTGSSEYIIFSGNQSDGTNHSRAIYKTTNGGTSITDISPTSGGVKYTPANLTTSIVFTTNPSIMAVSSNDTGQLFTSIDGAATWTAQTPTGYDTSSGFFPRLQGGAPGVYLGGASKPGYVPGFGAADQDKTGNWSSAVGGTGAWFGVSPLY